MGERDNFVATAGDVLPGAIEAGVEWMRRAQDAERKLQYKTAEWESAIEIARGYQIELERLRRIEQAARELIRIPALIQALGDNHVGGCSCSLCRLRSALDEGGKERMG